jgi:3-oxoacyl-(acyl-carrier-protein) synthase
VGAVSAAGVGTAPLLRRMLEGSSGLTRDPGLGGRWAGRAPALEPQAYTRRADRSAAQFFAAATEAWRDAGLEADTIDPERCAVIEGSSLGPLSGALERHALSLSGAAEYSARPTALVQFMTGAGGSMVAQMLGISGPVYHVSAGSISSMVAIGEAWQKIVIGLVDVAVVGGAECPLHPMIADHFEAAGILAPDECEHAGCRPFDRRRAGTVLGEGAGALVLESESHARRRGARPRVLLRGLGFARETQSMTAPDPNGSGVTASIRRATRRVRPDDIGWIKMHGTGTPLNDAAETRGLSAAFGDRLPDVWITSLKPLLGHALGASGALEAVAAIMALAEQTVPPTLCTEEIDPALPLCRVALHPEPCPSSMALILAEGFGGRCSAMAVERG